MGAFTLPTLPSLPSVKSFINTSPPLVYQKHLPRDSPNTTPTRNARRREFDTAQAQHQPRALLPSSPSRGDVSKEWDQVDRRRRASISSLKSSTSYSGSMNDLSNSVGSLNLSGVPRAPDPPSNSSSPVRPTHRRAQSAVPSAALRRPGPSPMGRLHEISRNPLASSSAISLPTLCELGDGSGAIMTNRPFPASSTYGASAPASPVAAPRTRRLSRPTPIERIDSRDADDMDNNPPPPSPSPLSLPGPLSTDGVNFNETIRVRARSRQNHHRSMSSVPPPNSMPPPISTIPPRPLVRSTTLMRPPSSPRSYSAEDTRPKSFVPSALGRRSSVSSNLRVVSTSVSDVAVMATWSFPTAGEVNPTIAGTTRRDSSASISSSHSVSEFGEIQSGVMSQPSLGLRQRLQSLSGLNTQLPTSSSSTSLCSARDANSPRTTIGSSIKRAHSTAIRTPTQDRGVFGHRHTHSSPHLLPLLPVSISGPINTSTYSSSAGSAGPLLPPPRPQRRPTTSRLRNPNPLCMPSMPSMPIHSNRDRERERDRDRTGERDTPNLSSSPGSLFSDSRSTSAGSDGEVLPSPNGSIVSLPPMLGHIVGDGRCGNGEIGGSGGKERGFIGRWIRGSRGSETEGTKGSQGAVVEGEERERGVIVCEDEGEDERYLSLDDI